MVYVHRASELAPNTRNFSEPIELELDLVEIWSTHEANLSLAQSGKNWSTH